MPFVGFMQNNGRLTLTPETGIKLTKRMADGVAAPDGSFVFDITNLTDPEANGSYDALHISADGTERETTVRFSDGAACCVIVASKGYPVKYESGYPMELPADSKDGFIYVAGAKKDGDRLLSAGGRVLGVTAVAATLDVAVKKAYERVEKVRFENGYHRSDIGARALAAVQK